MSDPNPDENAFEPRRPGIRRGLPRTEAEDYPQEREPMNLRGRRRPRTDQSSDARDDDNLYSTFIPYRNVTALIGYYCGMGGLIAVLGGFAFILLDPIQRGLMVTFTVVASAGGLLALLGVVFGILGVVHAGKHPRSRGLAHAITGIVLGTLLVLGILVIFLIGFVATRRF